MIDEIQKVPELLNVIHSLSKNKQLYFVLTDSSARKLKRGEVNLLAGRAFKFVCHSLIHLELGKQFYLDDVLRYGSLPEFFSLKPEEKAGLFQTRLGAFLLAY